MIPVLDRKHFEQVQAILRSEDFDSVAIHSDVFYGFKYEQGLKRNEQFLAHYQALKLIFNNLPLMMPVFNYSFPKTKHYNMQDDRSEVGALTEYFRKEHAFWRTKVPVFSYAGEGAYPLINENGIIDPFDDQSIFAQMINTNGIFVYYGAPFSSSTIIHFAERMSGCLCYRYDKLFNGSVTDNNGATKDVALKYHVRPMSNRPCDYDWVRLENDLLANGILHSIKDSRFSFAYIKTKDLNTYFVNSLKKNPLSLLNKESREWMEPELQRLGRPFQLADFE